MISVNPSKYDFKLFSGIYFSGLFLCFFSPNFYCVKCEFSLSFFKCIYNWYPFDRRLESFLPKLNFFLFQIFSKLIEIRRNSFCQIFGDNSCLIGRAFCSFAFKLIKNVMINCIKFTIHNSWEGQQLFTLPENVDKFRVILCFNIRSFPPP